MTQTIGYDDSRLSYLGRWYNPGTGMQSGWQGSQLRFNISGVSSFDVNASILDSSSSYPCALGVNIDQGDTVRYDFSTVAEVVTANRSVTVTLPDTGLHSVIIKTSACHPDDQFANTAKIILTSVTTADNAVITTWLQSGIRRIMCVGDSWMGAWMDWPMFLDSSLYKIYPVAYGGASAASMLSKIPYLINTTANAGDPQADVVIIGLGVNDYIGSITTAAFQSSVGSLIDHVRANQPFAPIVLIQPVRNDRDAKPYDVYSDVLIELAASKSNVVFLQTCSIWSQLNWATGDSAHLDFASRQILANHIGDELNKIQHVLSVKINSSAGILDTAQKSSYINNAGIVMPDYTICRFNIVPDDGVSFHKILTSAGIYCL